MANGSWEYGLQFRQLQARRPGRLRACGPCTPGVKAVSCLLSHPRHTFEHMCAALHCKSQHQAN